MIKSTNRRRLSDSVRMQDRQNRQDRLSTMSPDVFRKIFLGADARSQGRLHQTTSRTYNNPFLTGDMNRALMAAWGEVNERAQRSVGNLAEVRLELTVTKLSAIDGLPDFKVVYTGRRPVRSDNFDNRHFGGEDEEYYVNLDRTISYIRKGFYRFATSNTLFKDNSWPVEDRPGDDDDDDDDDVVSPLSWEMNLTFVTLGTVFNGRATDVEVVHEEEDAIICSSIPIDNLQGFDVFVDVLFPKKEGTDNVILPETCRASLTFRLDGDFLPLDQWQRMLLEYSNIVPDD